MKKILFVLLFCPALVLALTSSSFACCYDLDGDGYEGGEGCPHPPENLDCLDDPSGDDEICETCTCEDPDCTTCAKCIHPGAEESCCGVFADCFDEVDNDCDGLTDQEDPGCQEWCDGMWGAAEAEASTVGTPGVSSSRQVNYLAVLLVPLATILIRRWARRKKTTI